MPEQDNGNKERLPGVPSASSDGHIQKDVDQRWREIYGVDDTVLDPVELRAPRSLRPDAQPAEDATTVSKHDLSRRSHPIQSNFLDVLGEVGGRDAVVARRERMKRLKKAA